MYTRRSPSTCVPYLFFYYRREIAPRHDRVKPPRASTFYRLNALRAARAMYYITRASFLNMRVRLAYTLARIWFPRDRKYEVQSGVIPGTRRRFRRAGTSNLNARGHARVEIQSRVTLIFNQPNRRINDDYSRDVYTRVLKYLD